METASFLKPIYIAPDFAARSGVSSYAAKFFAHVLEPLGFKHVAFESVDELRAWYRLRGKEHRFHIEISVGSHHERDLLWALLDSAAVVDITLHDPPYVAFPYYRLAGRLLGQFSKGAQHVLPQHFFGLGRVRRIRTIYTLSERGRRLTELAYSHVRVATIPHLSVPTVPVQPAKPTALVYSGFIGRKKGLSYALDLHERLMQKFPELMFKIVGTPVDEISKRYLEQLRERYRRNVDLLGYVDDVRFAQILGEGHIALLPTQDYGTVCPVSGNIVNALTAGSLVVTTRANANEELIEDGVTGRFLTGRIEADTELIAELLTDAPQRRRMIAAARAEILQSNSPQRLQQLLSR